MDDDREEVFGELETGLNEQEIKMILGGKPLKRTPGHPEEYFISLLNPWENYKPEPAYR